MVLAGSRRIPRAPRYSGAALIQLPVSRTGLSPATVKFSTLFRYLPRLRRWRSYNPGHCLDNTGLGSCAFARHYWRNHYLFSLPAGNEMFQFPAFAPYLVW